MTRKEVVALLRAHCGNYETKKDAAAALGCTQVYMTDVIEGRRAPGRKILKGLGLKVEKVYERA